MSVRARRERRLALGLAAVLALLVAGIVATLRHDARTARAPASPPDADVSRLAIERSGRADLVLERGDGDWRVTAPCALDANDARVAPLLDALSAAAPSYPAAEVDLEAAGLLEPLATLRLDGTAVRLGATDLGGERRYARYGDTVALVPEWTLSLADGGLSALASPTLFDEAPRALRRVADEPPGGEGAALGAAASGSTPPDPAAWAALAARQIVPWPVPDAPPTIRRARLEAVLASGATRRLDIESNASWTAIRVDGGACAHIVGNDELPADTYP